MKNFARVSVCAGVFLLTGCLSDGGSGSAGARIGGSGSDLTPAQRIAQLESSGAIPQLDRSTDLGGPDSNANGVRDDIEAYISANYSDGAEELAALQFAESLQKAVLVDPLNVDEVKSISIQISRAVNCVYSSFASNNTNRPGLVVEQLRSITTNTRQRLTAYLNFSKALDGTSSALPSGDTCE